MTSTRTTLMPVRKMGVCASTPVGCCASPLMPSADARPSARGIKTKVLAHEMPPWHADARFGTFSNAPKLTQAQANTLAAWADADAPEGTGSAPAPPVFRDQWNPLMNRPP